MIEFLTAAGLLFVTGILVYLTLGALGGLWCLFTGFINDVREKIFLVAVYIPLVVYLWSVYWEYVDVSVGV